MRILVTGANGQVGWELVRCLLPLGEVVAADRRIMDLSDSYAIRDVVRGIKPDLIVNAAAYTAVDRAEEETRLAEQINGHAPGVMAEEVAKLGGLMVHYSTDYVFDGSSQSPYSEFDQTSPVNTYGQTKYNGEQAIMASGADYLIFRTSWVYASRGNNFLRTMVRLIAERDELGIVDDQVGAPTWARVISDSTLLCVANALQSKEEGGFSSGLYHLTCSGSTSWYGFAKKIKAFMRMKDQNLSPCHIKPIMTEEYPVPAARPKNSCLDTSRIEKEFRLVMPTWDHAMAQCMDELYR